MRAVCASAATPVNRRGTPGEVAAGGAAVRDTRPVTAPLIAIFGPTAVGKTAIAVEVARELAAVHGRQAIAIGADALQVYAELPLLTAQPSPAERAALPHELVGFLPVRESWDVARHAERAHALIDAALQRGEVPIVVGGTGLYLRAALTELDLAPPPPVGVREALLARAAQGGGPQALHTELVGIDPAAAALIEPGDTTRVVRAHELLAVGRSFADRAAQESQLWTSDLRRAGPLFGLTMERGALRARAELRLRAMVEAGAVAEAQAAQAAGIGPTAAAAVGYRELLEGDVDAAITATRRLAKRQETWMRKLGGVQILDVTERAPEDVASEIVRAWAAAAA